MTAPTPAVLAGSGDDEKAEGPVRATGSTCQEEEVGTGPIVVEAQHGHSHSYAPWFGFPLIITWDLGVASMNPMFDDLIEVIF